MPITQLNLDGPATKAELSRLEATNASAIEADITAEGVEADLTTTKKGWKFTAFIKRKWNGETSAGGRIKKDL